MDFWHLRLSGLSHGRLYALVHPLWKWILEGWRVVTVVSQVLPLRQVLAHFSACDSTYLTIMSMLYISSFKPLHFSSFCLSNSISPAFPQSCSLASSIMIIVSGLGAIWRPSSFQTGLLSPFSLQLLHCAYARYNMAWVNMLFWLAEGCSLIFNNGAAPTKRTEAVTTARNVLCFKKDEFKEWLRSTKDILLFFPSWQPQRWHCCDNNVQIQKPPWYFLNENNSLLKSANSANKSDNRCREDTKPPTRNSWACGGHNTSTIFDCTWLEENPEEFSSRSSIWAGEASR